VLGILSLSTNSELKVHKREILLNFLA
jgi:hypothetical protein